MSTFRESGFKWLGEIPSSWAIKKAKYLFKERSEKGNKIELQLLSPSQKFGVIPQELLKQQTSYNPVAVSEDANLQSFKTVHSGDFCISLSSYMGGFEFSEYEGVVSPAYHVFYKTTDLIHNYYYKYLFKSCAFIDLVNIITPVSVRVGRNTSFESFGNSYIPVPPIDVQKKIANYLDMECKKINDNVANLQKEIDVLEEYKRSIIIEKILHGISISTNKKESGIDYVGSIPSHWEMHPVFYYFKEGKNKNIGCKEQNLLSLSYGRVIRKDINTVGGLLPSSFATYNIVESGDIIIRPTDLQNDKKSLRTGIVKERGIITSAYLDLKPKKGVNSNYFRYQLHTFDLMKVFYNMGNGVRQGLNFEEFSKLMLIVPPETEQNEIVEFLDLKCQEIDAAISNRKIQISNMDLLKESLIYEYVTGKKEIPDEQSIN